MRVSDKFLVLLEQFEGFRECPYLDAGGVPTIGIGTTHYPTGVKVRMVDTCIKHDRAVAYVKTDVGYIEDIVNADLPKLSQNQFDALVSFIYNVGTQAFADSTLLRKAKVNPDDPTIALEFAKWVHVKGKPNSDLVARRHKESELYFQKPVQKE